MLAVSNGTSCVELWTSGGSEGTTLMLQDIAPGPGSSSPADFTVSNNKDVFFTANDNATGVELWVISNFAKKVPKEIRKQLKHSRRGEKSGNIVSGRFTNPELDFEGLIAAAHQIVD